MHQSWSGRLERHDPPLVKTWFPEQFRSWFYGQNLNLAHPTLEGYFEEAERFNQQLDQLFPPGQGLAARVGDILAALDHGRPFVAAPGPAAAQRYMFTTLRAHLEDGFLPPHFDNEQALRPSYRHLQSLVELHMTSFVLTLSAPEAGGALEVFITCANDLVTLKMRSCLGWTEEALQRECEYVAARAYADGGRAGEFFWILPPPGGRF